MAARAVRGTPRLVVFIQENKTVDFMFPSLAEWGALVVPNSAPLRAAPMFDQPHDPNAWVHYAMGDYPAVKLSIDDIALVPFYSWLAKTFTFCDHHFSPGTNSTSGHLLAFTGQTPTFKTRPSPVLIRCGTYQRPWRIGSTTWRWAVSSFGSGGSCGGPA